MPIRRIMYADVSNSLSSNEPWINAYWWTDCRVVMIGDRLNASSSACSIGVSQGKIWFCKEIWQYPSKKDPAAWDWFLAYSACFKTLILKQRNRKNRINLHLTYKEMRSQKTKCSWSRSPWRPVAELKIELRCPEFDIDASALAHLQKRLGPSSKSRCHQRYSVVLFCDHQKKSQALRGLLIQPGKCCDGF